MTKIPAISMGRPWLLLACSCLCLASLACGGPKPAVSAFSPADLERLVRLQQSLDQLDALLDSGQADPSGTEAIRVELQAFLDSMPQGNAFPFRANLQRLVDVLSESQGQPSPEQSNDAKAEILAMVEWMEANGTNTVPDHMLPAGGASPGATPAAAPGPGPGGPGGFGPGGGGPGPGAGGPPGGPGGRPKGPDTGEMQLELERKQRSAKEAMWRARAEATNAAVEQTRAAYEQAMSIHPRPGDSPAMIEQTQAAAKAAMEAAEKAQADLTEEARRAGVPPGWIRVR